MADKVSWIIYNNIETSPTDYSAEKHVSNFLSKFLFSRGAKLKSPRFLVMQLVDLHKYISISKENMILKNLLSRIIVRLLNAIELYSIRKNILQTLLH